MIGPFMPMCGPMMRNRFPVRTGAPFPQRYMHPHMLRPAVPPHARK